MSDYCPAPQAFASWSDFTTYTKVVKGESAYQTVKRFRIAEARKNAAGQRIWMGLKRCRDQDIPAPKTKATPTDVLIGGLQ